MEDPEKDITPDLDGPTMVEEGSTELTPDAILTPPPTTEVDTVHTDPEETAEDTPEVGSTDSLVDWEEERKAYKLEIERLQAEMNKSKTPKAKLAKKKKVVAKVAKRPPRKDEDPDVNSRLTDDLLTRRRLLMEDPIYQRRLLAEERRMLAEERRMLAEEPMLPRRMLAEEPMLPRRMFAEEPIPHRRMLAEEPPPPQRRLLPEEPILPRRMQIEEPPPPRRVTADERRWHPGYYEDEEPLPRPRRRVLK